MDSYEIDSEASFDSFHLNSEDFNIPSPHLISQELSKKLQDLELENEKLRYSLENSKTEVVSLKASNKGLKEKIGELFQEAQTSLQEKLKLENNCKEKECQLAIIENSSKWYQARLHESEAVNKGLRMDLEAYQKILAQREHKIAELMDKSEENDKLRSKLEELESKYLRERENWRQERNFLADNKMAPVHRMADDVTTFELKKRIAEMVHQLEIAEKRYLNVEMSRNLAEEKALKCRRDIEKMAEDVNKMAVAKNEAIEKLKVLGNHGDDLRIENERLSVMLLASKKEKSEVEEGIVQLRLQLMKMIAQYKAVKSRSLEAEKRVKEMEKESERLKTKAVAVNNSMLRKIKEERNKSKILEELLEREKAKSIVAYQKGETISSMTICLQRALNREKELKDRIKLLSKSSDESVDEGYGDISGFTDIPLASTSSIDSNLMNFAINLIMKSQNFMGPVDASLNELEAKIKKLGDVTGLIKCR